MISNEKSLVNNEENNKKDDIAGKYAKIIK